MERVTGIGGIFFKATDPAKLADWYEKNLGIPKVEHGSSTFEWREADDASRTGQTVWSPFAADTRYFAPSNASFMVNYRVKDLHAMLAQLRAAGVTVDEKIEESEFGRFGWVFDPDGNKIELWEPPATYPPVAVEPDTIPGQ